MSYAAKLLATATAFHQAGNLSDAEKTYRKLLRVEAVNADALRLLGGLYLQMREWLKAVEYLEKAVRFRGDDPETLANLGYALRGVGRAPEAIEVYRKALKIKPDYIQAMTNLGSLYQETGKYTDASALFRQILQLSPDNPAAHYNYGNLLYVSGQFAEAQRHYEHSLKLRPDYHEAMINLGMVLSQMGKTDLSQQWLEVACTWFEKALAADPNNVVALNNMANVRRQQDKPEEAVVLYRRALELRPEYAEAALNLATSLRDLGQVDDAIDYCLHVLDLQPNSADARNNLGTFLQELGRHDEALRYFTESLQFKPDSVDAKWNKGISLMALGRYKEGLVLHETGLGVPHMRGEYPSPERRWNGENFVGKRLLLWCEQGLGDSLQFIRYVEAAKARGGEVIVLCPRSLRKLFSNIPFIDALPESVDEKTFDIHAPLMSLPYIFGTTLDTIPAQMPYLHISDEVRAKWADKLGMGSGFKVGLVWAGNPREHWRTANLIDRRRSMNLKMFRPLFDIPGVEFCNLQMGDAAVAQIDSCGLRSRFVDPMPDVKDFEDTGAIMEQLDLIISVDTSVVHLAGGLGRPVWIMSRFDACWRWLQNQPDSPWYPTAKIFGQSAPGDWAGVVATIHQALQERLSC